MFIDRAEADIVQNTSDYWATTGRLLADTVGFTSSRRPLWWYLRNFRNRELQKCCKYAEVGRRLLVKCTLFELHVMTPQYVKAVGRRNIASIYDSFTHSNRSVILRSSPHGPLQIKVDLQYCFRPGWGSQL